MDEDDIETGGETSKEEKIRIDAQLKYMEVHDPGPHTIEEIAIYAGCIKRRIHAIQERAIMKIVAALILDIDEIEKHAKG